MKITLYPESCCDDCNEIVHVHIDCPSCKEEFARSDCYHDPFIDLEIGDIIQCYSCKAKFKLITKIPYCSNYSGYDWEQIDV